VKITHEVMPNGKPYFMLRKGIGFSFAERKGRAVLKGQTRPWKINGIWINTDKGCHWIIFRRHFEF